MTPGLDAIATEVGRHGLIPRGAFRPDAGDGLPEGTASVVLVGNAGPALWQAFTRDVPAPAGPDPLDAWTRAVLGAIAERLGADVLFPFDGPPYWPFQRWAMKGDAVFASPIGPSIHPDFGLWHAYRAALLFAEPLALPARPAAASPCESCAAKPCLSTCPVAALAPGAYDVPACVAHLDGPAGADCMNLGCRARRACPAGRAFTYAPAQAAFHMAHFRATNRGGGPK